MICPNCHYQDDRLPNCLVCGGRGVVGEDKTTNESNEHEGKKEDTVKTFAERLVGFEERFDAEMARAPVMTVAEAEAEFDRNPRTPGVAQEQAVFNLLHWVLVMMARETMPVTSAAVVSVARCSSILTRLVFPMLRKKNASYNDTALNPKRYFSSGTALELIFARIDDKINRRKKSAKAFREKPLKDLAGYLVLAYLAMEDEWDAAVRAGTYCPTHRMRWNRCGCVPA